MQLKSLMSWASSGGRINEQRHYHQQHAQAASARSEHFEWLAYALEANPDSCR
jgi:hypothetical protein